MKIASTISKAFAAPAWNELQPLQVRPGYCELAREGFDRNGMLRRNKLRPLAITSCSASECSGAQFDSSIFYPCYCQRRPTPTFNF